MNRGPVNNSSRECKNVSKNLVPLGLTCLYDRRMWTCKSLVPVFFSFNCRCFQATWFLPNRFFKQFRDMVYVFQCHSLPQHFHQIVLSSRQLLSWTNGLQVLDFIVLASLRKSGEHPNTEGIKTWKLGCNLDRPERQAHQNHGSRYRKHKGETTNSQFPAHRKTSDSISQLKRELK